MIYFGARQPKIKLITDDGLEIIMHANGNYTRYAKSDAVAHLQDGYIQAIVPLVALTSFLNEYFEKQQYKFLKIYLDTTGDLCEVISMEDKLAALELMSKVQYKLGG